MYLIIILIMISIRIMNHLQEMYILKDLSGLKMEVMLLLLFDPKTIKTDGSHYSIRMMEAPHSLIVNEMKPG